MGRLFRAGCDYILWHRHCNGKCRIDKDSAGFPNCIPPSETMWQGRTLIPCVLVGLAAFQFVSSENLCYSQTNCLECIKSVQCAWCLDADISLRCQPIREASCTKFETMRGSIQFGSIPESWEVEPNKGPLPLVLHRPQAITVDVFQSKEYPIDAYFLLDLSFSMEESRKTFAEESGNVLKALGNFTSDLNIGFGSFVDKDLAPFTSTISSFSCSANITKCAERPYGFHHQISLAQIDSEDFKAKLLDAALAGNVDDPEGSLDALLQVMACDKEIKWRKDSRKIIVLATDRDFHFATDGKLAGILDINDGKCHMDIDGYYTHSKLLDYPSLSQVGAKIYEGKFLLIAAVIPRYKEIWESIQDIIPNMEVTIMEKDALNIVHIIESNLKRITTTISIEGRVESATTLDEKGFKVFVTKVSDKCEDPSSFGLTCLEVPVEERVRFRVTIEVQKCLLEPKHITISMVGLNSQLDLIVTAPCACSCEDDAQPSHPACSNQGNLTCSICECEPGFVGKACECNKDNNDQTASDKCVDPFGVSDSPCHGRGDCTCGVCVDCRDSQGKYCQCTDDNCPQDAFGHQCSGRGQCDCGNCVCQGDWTGEDCGCTGRTEGCISPYNQEMCSGQGHCECNACQCSGQVSKSYSGKHCQLASGETSPCQVFEDCVECLAFETGIHAENQCKPCKHIFLREINSSDVAEAQWKCHAFNKGACEFIYHVDSGGEMSLMEVFLHAFENGETQKCGQINTMGIAFGVFGSVLLIGVISVLFWKCYTVIDDRRQYARFLKDSEKLRHATNQTPNEMYRSPQTTYKNPMHGQDFPMNKL